jgi:hypothetical protein
MSPSSSAACPACSGIVLVKYWLSNRDDEQFRRFRMRIQDPMERWRLSPMDLQSRVRWQQYAHAKEAMLDATNIPKMLWWAAKVVVKKKSAAELHPPPPQPDPFCRGPVRPADRHSQNTVCKDDKVMPYCIST